MSSKIKVDTIENVAGSGNVSLGSGHNLVVPGDLTVDTSTLKVDSSNNRVGVGIASPTHPLSVNGQIKSTGSNGETVQLQTSSQYTGISFIGSDGTRDAIIDYDHTAGVMGIKAHTSAHKISMTTGGYDERLSIDAAGRVTMPAQPAFSTYGTAGNVSFTGGTESTITAWNTMIFNSGGHFNVGTGKFTAPIAGKYFFRSQLYMQNFTGVFRFRIYKNTSVAVYHYYNAAASPGPAFIAGFLNLAANDTVHLTGNPDNTGNIYFADNHSNFDGYLVL